MKDSADSAGTLRSEAEVKLATETPATLQDIPAVDLVHEIQVHQIELEMLSTAIKTRLYMAEHFFFWHK